MSPSHKGEEVSLPRDVQISTTTTKKTHKKYGWGGAGNMSPPKAHSSLATDSKYIDMDEMPEKAFKRMIFKKFNNSKKSKTAY